MLYNDGISAAFYLSETHTDYMPGYMYVLWLKAFIESTFDLTHGSFMHRFVFVLPSVLADLAAGVFIYMWAGGGKNEEADVPQKGKSKYSKKWKAGTVALFLGLAYVLNPAIILISSLWGQIDSILALILLVSVYWLTKKKFLAAFFLYSIGIIVKQQAIVFGPIFLFFLWDHLRTNKFSGKAFFEIARNGAICVAALIIIVLPFGFMGSFDGFAANERPQTLIREESPGYIVMDERIYFDGLRTRHPVYITTQMTFINHEFEIFMPGLRLVGSEDGLVNIKTQSQTVPLDFQLIGGAGYFIQFHIDYGANNAAIRIDGMHHGSLVYYFNDNITLSPAVFDTWYVGVVDTEEIMFQNFTVFSAPTGFSLIPVAEQFMATLDQRHFATVNAYNLWGALGLNWYPTVENIPYGVFSIQPPQTLIRVSGYILGIGGAVVMGVWLLFKSKSTPNYFFAGAMIFATFFMLSVRIHDRYAFVAMPFLLAAYVFSGENNKIGKRDIRYLWVYIAFSFASFLNYAVVLYHSVLINRGELGWWAPSVIRQSTMLSWLGVATFIYLIYLAFKVRKPSRNH